VIFSVTLFYLREGDMLPIELKLRERCDVVTPQGWRVASFTAMFIAGCYYVVQVTSTKRLRLFRAFLARD